MDGRKRIRYGVIETALTRQHFSDGRRGVDFGEHFVRGRVDEAKHGRVLQRKPHAHSRHDQVGDRSIRVAADHERMLKSRNGQVPAYIIQYTYRLCVKTRASS